MPRSKAVPPAAVPPGPLQLEVRVNGHVKFLQRVYGYTIDQEPDQFAVYGLLRPAEPKPPVKAAPVAEVRFEADGDVTEKEG
jgi:hypothetical protein